MLCCSLAHSPIWVGDAKDVEFKSPKSPMPYEGRGTYPDGRRSPPISSSASSTLPANHLQLSLAMSTSPPPAAAVATTPEAETAPVLSKTQQRKLARQQALAEAEAAASSSSGPPGPAMSAQEAEERLESIGSACGAVLGKRIKLLSKKAVSPPLPHLGRASLAIAFLHARDHID